MRFSVPDGRPLFYPSRALDDASRCRVRTRRCTPPSACKADRPGRAWGLAACSSAPRVRRRPLMLTCETTPPGSSFKCLFSGKQRRRPGRSGFQRGTAKCRRPTGGRPPMVGLSAAGDGRPLRASIQPVERTPCLRRATKCWRATLAAAHAPPRQWRGYWRDTVEHRTKPQPQRQPIRRKRKPEKCEAAS